MSPRVLLTLAGADPSIESLRAWATSADVLVGVDSGADRLLEAGLRCDLLIGDLDSVSEAGRNNAIEVVYVAEQHSTDFDKALSLTEERYSAAEVLCFGVEGDQADHVLHNWTSLIRSRLNVAAALRRGLGIPIHPGPPQQFQLDKDRRVSLLAKLPSRGVTLSGVEWPLIEAELEPGGRASISNRSTGPVKVSIERGVAILFLETKAGVWPSEVRRLAA